MKLIEGKFQFIYNVGNGDIRVYDIFSDGQIQEKISKTNDVNFISTDEAIRRIDEMIVIADREKKRYKNTVIYNKTSKTRLDILLIAKRFMLENPIEEDEVRYF